MNSFRIKRIINEKQLIMSDDDFLDFYEIRKRKLLIQVQGGQCPVCFDYKQDLTSFCGCDKHLLCSECQSQAKISEILNCSFCPIPSSILHLKCPSCSHIGYYKKNNDLNININIECVKCLLNFIPKISRIFKRNTNTYTNFITENEFDKLQLLYNTFDGCVWCPTCHQPLQRLEACNELYHCGYEKVCSCCGKFSFRWEKNGLLNHRKESNHCSSNSFHLSQEVEIEFTKQNVFQSIKNLP